MKSRAQPLRVMFALAIIGLVGTSGAIAAQEPTVDAAPFPGDNYPARKVSFPDGVTGLADLTYETLPGYRPLQLDLYRPSTVRAKDGAAALLPLVIYIHGGGWAAGHSRQSGAFHDFPKVLGSIAARGYVVASLNYRLSGEAPFPAAIQDVKAAVRWLRFHAAEYGIDKTRAVVWGGSAGGQLAALAATTCGVKELEPVVAGPAPVDAAALSQESDCVQGAVTWYGIFDFSSLPVSQTTTPAAPGSPVPTAAKYLGCSAPNCSTDTVRLASPICFVNAQTPPFLMIHGSVDKTVNPDQSRRFDEAMTKAGAHDDLLIIPDVDHSFIGNTPKDTQIASLEALRRTISFIEKTLGPPRRE